MRSSSEVSSVSGVIRSKFRRRPKSELNSPSTIEELPGFSLLTSKTSKAKGSNSSIISSKEVNKSKDSRKGMKGKETKVSTEKLNGATSLFDLRSSTSVYNINSSKDPGGYNVREKYYDEDDTRDSDTAYETDSDTSQVSYLNVSKKMPMRLRKVSSNDFDMNFN